MKENTTHSKLSLYLIIMWVSLAVIYFLVDTFYTPFTTDIVQNVLVYSIILLLIINVLVNAFIKYFNTKNRVFYHSVLFLIIIFILGFLTVKIYHWKTQKQVILKASLENSIYDMNLTLLKNGTFKTQEVTFFTSNKTLGNYQKRNDTLVLTSTKPDKAYLSIDTLIFKENRLVSKSDSVDFSFKIKQNDW